ncbi:hypothetical protein KAU45_01615, partial [bacterium]|nr:hypothetical protein [bacterium]
MRRTPMLFISLCLLVALAGCASEGGDPTEAVPKEVFLVVYVPSIAGVWDGVDHLIAELRQVEPRMAEEAVRKIEGLVLEMFGTEEPPVESLQELWDEGVDVYKPFIIAVGGFPVPQPIILVSLHTPSSFSDFYYESIGEEEPEPIETYSDVDVRLSRGFYSAQTDGLFIASESFPLMKSCIDTLGDPEKRFFEGDPIRPLLANYSDYTAALFVDLCSVKGLVALAMTQAPEVPGFVRDQMTKVESVGLGLRIQPEGIRLTASAFGDFAEVGKMERSLPVPRDCLAFFGGDKEEITLKEKTELAGLLVGALSMHPDAAEFIEAVGEENLISLILSIGQRSFLFVHDAGWMPGITFGLELADPELFKLIYDEKLRPLLESAITEELSVALLERRVVDDVEMDVLTLGGPLILPVTPALAFYDDYLILTTDAKMVGQI